MRWVGYTIAVTSVFAIVAILLSASVRSDGVAATLLLLDVVVVARWFSLGPALTTAALGAATYSYFFLPPAGFAIEKPEDWFGFIAFIITAVIAGELSARAERRAAEAQAGRREIERLYQELKAAFERASDAEAAKRNEQLKAALLDALTHNLRTPLTAIKAAVTALRAGGDGRTMAGLPQEGRDELLQVIDEESDRLNRFIEGLAAADSTTPTRPEHLRVASLASVIRTALMRAETLTRDHRVIAQIEKDVPDIAVDGASITEVLYILLDNASKYAPPRTTIAVKATRQGDRQVRLSVTDEGPGIPPDLLDRVFDKFFRVPRREAHDPRRGGVGLGLPIACRLVEAQGGRIWIDPTTTRGTSVMMVLPEAQYEYNDHDIGKGPRAGSGRRAADNEGPADRVDQPGVSGEDSRRGRSGALEFH